MMKYLFLLLLLAGLNACKYPDSQKFESVQVNLDEHVQEEIKFSQFVDSMTSITLETTNESLLGKIKDVILEDTFLFVLPKEGNAVYIFNRNGKYLRKINRRGNGPGEYPYINQIGYNKKRKSLSIVSSKVIEYDLYGNVKNEINLGHYAMNDLYPLDNGDYLLSRLGETETPEGVIRIDSTGRKKEILYQRDPDYKIRNSHCKELLPIKGEIHFISPQIENNIYIWNGDSVRLETSFKITPEVSSDFYATNPRVLGLGKNYYRTVYQESEKWILLCYWSQTKNTRFLLYNKATRQYQVGKVLKNDIDGTESPYFLSASSSNTFTNYRESEQIENNPVIQILHLK